MHYQLLDTIIDALKDDPAAIAALSGARQIVAEHLGQSDDVDLMTATMLPFPSVDRFMDLVDMTTKRLLANTAVRSWSRGQQCGG